MATLRLVEFQLEPQPTVGRLELFGRPTYAPCQRSRAPGFFGFIRSHEMNPQETRWSLVLRACAGSGEALEELAHCYWPVVYAFLRRKGVGHEDAEDLSQETFSRLLASGSFPSVDARRGRFRSFLFACAEHEASHLHERNGTRKRGANRVIPMDPQEAAKFGELMAFSGSPDERAFDRAWSHWVVAKALEKVRRDYTRLGKSDLCEAFVAMLRVGLERGDHRMLAAKFGLSEGHARVAWTRFKAAFTRRVREEVLQTVANPADLAAELEHLMAAWLSSPS